MSDERMKKIREFIVENFLFGDDSSLQENTSFLESGIIDSTGILELVAFLEQNMSIQVQDDELIPDNLDSLNNISQFLNKKLSCVE